MYSHDIISRELAASPRPLPSDSLTPAQPLPSRPKLVPQQPPDSKQLAKSSSSNSPVFNNLLRRAGWHPRKSPNAFTLSKAANCSAFVFIYLQTLLQGKTLISFVFNSFCTLAPKTRG